MKAITVAVMIAVMTAALLLVLVAAFALVASTRGVVGHLGGGWYARRAAEIARVAIACGVAGAMGFAFTSAVRRTAGAIAGFLALAFIVEPALTNNFSWLRGVTPTFALLAATVDRFSSGGGFAGFSSLGHSLLVLAIWAIVVFLVCSDIFVRREVR
jgi:ABC-type transport system involved in multi-copper enzyme maturation permease subunit